MKRIKGRNFKTQSRVSTLKTKQELGAQISRQNQQIKKKLAHYMRTYAMDKIDEDMNHSINNSIGREKEMKILYDTTMNRMGEVYKALGQSPKFSTNPYELRKQLQPRELTEAELAGTSKRGLSRMRNIQSKFGNNNMLTLVEHGEEHFNMLYRNEGVRDSEKLEKAGRAARKLVDDSYITGGDIPRTKSRKDRYNPLKARDNDELMFWMGRYEEMLEDPDYHYKFLTRAVDNWLNAAKDTFPTEVYERAEQLARQYAPEDFFKLIMTRSWMEIEYVYEVGSDARGMAKIIDTLETWLPGGDYEGEEL